MDTYEDELNDIIADYERNMTIFKESYALAKLYPNDPSYTTSRVRWRLTESRLAAIPTRRCGFLFPLPSSDVVVCSVFRAAAELPRRLA